MIKENIQTETNVLSVILSNIIKHHGAELADDRAFLVCKTPLITWNSCPLHKGTTSAL